MTTAIRPFENENMLLNMSVWRDVKSLNRYVYSSAHVEIMRRRKEWFERMMTKLELLRSKGPSPEAFTFRQAFGPPDSLSDQSPVTFGALPRRST